MSAKHRRKPYMPDSDSGKARWMETFITTIESDRERFGFTDPYMFEYYQRTIRTFITAVAKVASPATCTPGAVAEKNRARKEAVKLCREFAMQLKWDSSLTIKDKIALGICTDDSPAEKASLPEGALPGTVGFPELAVLSSPSGGHVIRYRECATLTGSKSKAKPKGVSHFLLFAAIGEKPNMRRTHARLLGAYTKRPFEIMYPMACGLEGLCVTYYGRWLTTRGEMSPWSRPVSKIIGDTQLKLGDCGFSHLFEKTGFIDALPGVPEGAARIIEDRPLLEGDANESDGLFAAIEAKLETATVRLLNAA